MATFLARAIQNLSPKVTGSYLIKQAEEHLKIMEQYIVPMSAIDERLGSESYVYQRVQAQIKANRKIKRFDGRVISLINKIATDRVGERHKLISQLDKALGRDVSLDAMDYEVAHYVGLVNMLVFFNRYCRYFLSVIVAEGTKSEHSAPTKEQQSFVMNAANITTFVQCCQVMTKSASEIDRELKKLRGIKFSPEQADANAKLHGDKFSPLSDGFIPMEVNVFYWVQEVGVDLLVKFYDLLKADKARYELLIIEKRAETQGAEGVDLETIREQIEYYEGVITTYQGIIENIEASVED